MLRYLPSKARPSLMRSSLILQCMLAGSREGPPQTTRPPSYGRIGVRRDTGSAEGVHHCCIVDQRFGAHHLRVQLVPTLRQARELPSQCTANRRKACMFFVPMRRTWPRAIGRGARP